MNMAAKSRAKAGAIQAVVIRADGSREDLGTVSHSSWWWNHGPARLLAKWRTDRANRRLSHG